MALYLRSQTDVESFLQALIFRKRAVMFLPSPAVYSKQTNKQKLGDAVTLFESNHHSTIYLRHLIIMSTEIWTLEAGTAEWKEWWTGSEMMPSSNFKLSGPFPPSFARIKTAETSRGPSRSNQLWWCDFLILTFVLGSTDEGMRQTVRTSFLLRLLTRSPHPERLHAEKLLPYPQSSVWWNITWVCALPNIKAEKTTLSHNQSQGKHLVSSEWISHEAPGPRLVLLTWTWLGEAEDNVCMHFSWECLWMQGRMET